MTGPTDPALRALIQEYRREKNPGRVLGLWSAIDARLAAAAEAAPLDYPKHGTDCAAQGDDEPCVCGVSDAYALGLREGAEAAPLDVDALAGALAILWPDVTAIGFPRDDAVRLAREYAALRSPDTETVCAFRGCGLPERLHGAPPGEPPNPTSSTHRFIPDTETAGEAG